MDDGIAQFQKGTPDRYAYPHAHLKEMQNAGELTELFVLQEELKGYPWGAVYEEYCRRTNPPAGNEWFEQIKAYEQTVLVNRN